MNLIKLAKEMDKIASYDIKAVGDAVIDSLDIETVNKNLEAWGFGLKKKIGGWTIIGNRLFFEIELDDGTKLKVEIEAKAKKI